MKIAVPKEILDGERRVALIPESATRLTKAGFSITIEAGAGAAAHFTDDAYREAGAAVATDPDELYRDAGLIVKINRPARHPDLDTDEVSLYPEGAALISFLHTLSDPSIAETLAARQITSFAMEAVPRIARAQSMDALSSMASLGGYKAVLIAANSLAKYFPMMMTAAGTIPPARGLILGAGVAGLQAIATSVRLGAVVEAFDVRPAVKEQVESLGASFVEVDYGEETEDTGGYARELTEDAQRRQREKIHERLQVADFVITTAAIPGRRAPTLITAAMAADMKPGSVIVDLAAETGGNCELTEAGKTVEKNRIQIHGPVNVPSMMPDLGSQLYARNVSHLISHLIKDLKLQMDFDDAITAGCCITYEGKVVHEATQSRLAEKS